MVYGFGLRGGVNSEAQPRDAKSESLKCSEGLTRLRERSHDVVSFEGGRETAGQTSSERGRRSQNLDN